MANPHVSECPLQVGDTIYTVAYDWNAICSLEQQLGMPIGEISQAGASATNMRALLFQGLQKNHPNITLGQAGDIIASLGGFGAIAHILTTALRLAFPEVAVVLDKPLNPQQPGTTG